MEPEALLKRIEEQAVRIAHLEGENKVLSERLQLLPGKLRYSLLMSLSRQAVNCGHRSSCYLANEVLESDKKGH